MTPSTISSADRLTKSRQAVLKIDLQAIAYNFQQIKGHLAPCCRIMPMVKANMYGTDAQSVAECLQKEGAAILGVATVDEALQLRRSGIKTSLFILFAAEEELVDCVREGFEVAVSTEAEIAALEKECKRQKKHLKLHLFCDTGMLRLGCPPGNCLTLAHKIHSSPFLQLEGLMTHFATAATPEEDSFTFQQMTSFENALQMVREAGIPFRWTHCANSAAITRFQLPQYNMVRPGASLLGIHAQSHLKSLLPLKLALQLSAPIVHIHYASPGDTVSYDRLFAVRSKSRIAVLPLGYHDVFNWNLSGKGYSLVHGQRAPWTGRMCMDFMMIDISGIPQAQIGDRVTLLGESHGHWIFPEEFAEEIGAGVYELIAKIGSRVRRQICSSKP